MSFADDLHRWQSFFGLEGAATASFAGLLFVALSLNGQLLRETGNKPLMLLAKQTFFNLLMLTAVSLLALAPEVTAISFGASLLGGSMSGLFTCLAAIREERRFRGSEKLKRETARAFYNPAMVYAFLTMTGFALLSGRTRDPSYYAFGSLFLVMASARNAWLLLVTPTK